MWIYLINLLMVLIWTILLKISGSKDNRYLVIILFFQLYFLLAFRDPNVGSDTRNYILIFERIKTYSFTDFSIGRYEPGFLLLNKLISFIEEPQLFIAIMAFIPLFFFFKFISTESKIVWLSVFLFITLGFYTGVFNVFRQSIAMGFVVLSYKYIKNNDTKKFFLFVIIASTFHISALAFMPIYFLRKLEINSKILLFYLFAGVITFLFSGPIINIILELAVNIDYEVESRGGFNFLIFLMFIAFLGLVFKKPFLLSEPKASILYHILFIGIIFQILALDFALMTRVTRFFTIFIIIFIPNIIASIQGKQAVVLGIYILCCFTALYYYIGLQTDVSSIVPYNLFEK